MLLALAILSSLTAKLADAEPATFGVTFKLTDLDLRPIPAASVRLVLGRERGWQAAEAGRRFVTAANGEQRVQMAAVLEPDAIKRPTNFLDGLFSRAEPADYLQVAAELEYVGHRWLYVADLHRFRRDGLMAFSGFSVYTRGPKGNYTEKAQVSEQGWLMRDLGGLMLSDPGHDLWDFALQPDTSDPERPRWDLTIGFKRAAEPVRR